eukprot:GSChrysophyteH1.ASY1.ANO1.252.1 assembled CDS
MENNFLNRGVEVVKVAIAADDGQNYKEAIKQYKNAAELFILAIKYETNPETVKQIHSRLVGYVTRADELQKALDEGATDPGGKTGGSDSAGTATHSMAGSILSEKPDVKWDDVAGLEMAKESLKEAVILPARFPQLFTGKRQPWKGILLYGPPGTGKSYLAKALATEADSTFFSISSSDLVSKWQGESERLVKSVFQLAREKQPSIRSEGESEATRRIKTEFLVQMDGVGSNQTGVLILGATNVPWEIDQAMRRRFEKRVYIALPERQARSRMFRIHLGDTENTLTEEEFDELGDLAEGYSGSDISVVVRAALMEPLRKCQQAKQFYEDSNTGKLMPCSDYPACPDCPMQLSEAPLPKFAKCSECSAVRMNLYEVPSEKLEVPVICYADFVAAISRQHSSVGANELEEYVKWTSMYGQDG